MTDDEDFGRELGEQLRAQADQTGPRTDLTCASRTQAHTLMRRRRLTTVVVGVISLVLAGGVLTSTVLFAGADTTPAGTPAPTYASAFTPSAAPSSARPSTLPPSPSPTTPTPPTPTPPASTPPASSGTPDRPPSGTDTPVPPPAPPGCRITTTAVDVVPAEGGGSAGSYLYELRVTNTGSTPCVLAGFAGVSLVYGDDGTQAGAAAVSVDESHTAVVAPGETASARLLIADAAAYGDDCDQVQARGFRVYLPNLTDSVFVEHPVLGCLNSDVRLLRLSSFGA